MTPLVYLVAATALCFAGLVGRRLWLARRAHASYREVVVASMKQIVVLVLLPVSGILVYEGWTATGRMLLEILK